MPEKKYLRSNLFELLGTFSKPEMKKFDEFLKSPYHNKSKKLIKAFQFVKKYYPEFKHDKLTLQNIHNSIDPQKKYHAPTVRNVLSDMYEMALRFLSGYSFFSDERFSYNFILNQLNERKLYSLFDRLYKNIQPLIDVTKGLDIDSPFFSYLINTQKCNKEVQSMEYKGDNISNEIEKVLKLYDDGFYDFHTFSIVKHIEFYILFKFFDLDNGFDISQRKVVKTIVGFINHARKQLKKCNKANPLLLINLKAFDAFYQIENDLKYFEYKKVVIKYSHILKQNHLSAHCIFLINYCHYKRDEIINRKTFTNELLSLYDLYLEKELYKSGDNKYLSYLDFRNMLTISLSNGNIKWAKNLTSESNIQKLANQDRIPLMNLGLMYINYYSGNYDLALEYGNMINLRKFRYLKFDVYDTTLKIYFERENYESASNLIRSYLQTIEKTEIIGLRRKTGIKNFLLILRKLIMIIYEKKTEEIEINASLLEEVNIKMKNAAYSNWLTEKLEEITNKMKKVRAF